MSLALVGESPKPRRHAAMAPTGTGRRRIGGLVLDSAHQLVQPHRNGNGVA